MGSSSARSETRIDMLLIQQGSGVCRRRWGVGGFIRARMGYERSFLWVSGLWAS